jgi:hypothetical protein
MNIKISGKHYSFKTTKDLLVNDKCNENCIALDRTLMISNFKVKSTKNQIHVPLGSYVCKEILRGSSIMGVDKNKDMKAFCFFKEDKSMIELNSLSNYAKNFSQK